MTRRVKHTSNMDTRKRRRRHSTCRFFKLMFSPSSLSTKLRIPKYFVKKVLRDEIASTAILKVPTGETRIVALVEEDNELWFRDGWKEFVEHFSIVYNYFLIFEYEGSSKYNVHIFDLTASEITYPSNAHNTCQEHNDQPYLNVIENDSDNDDAEKSELLHKPPVSLKDTVQQGSDDEETEIVEECSPFGTRYPFWLKTYEGLIKAAISAGISLLKNPFFVAAIKPYVLDKGFLNVPRAFGQDHLGHESKLIKLEAYDGRQWEVKFSWYSTKYTFRSGWKTFVQANDLQEGDVCVFELIGVKDYVLRVHVAKKSEIKVAEQLDLLFEE